MSHDREERRDQLLAYFVGALDEHESERIRELLETDSAWQAAAIEARLMQAGLEQACVADAEAPRDLAARTKRRLARPFAAGPRLLATAAVVAAGVLLVLGGWWLSVSPARAALLWRADDRMLAGGLLVPEVVVRSPASGEPLANVELTASVRDEAGVVTVIGMGRTSESGVLATPWRVPDLEPGNYALRVEARDGATLLDGFTTRVTVISSARLVLSPDRPAARPGEVIRVRALFKRDDGGAPIMARPLTFDLLDAQGNRLGHHRRETSRYGLAWTEFPLDRELPEGTYTLRAEADGVRAERTFRIERYRLPVYDLRVELDRGTFDPLQRVTGRVVARTFDGHAITGLQAEVGLASEEALLKLDDAGTGEFTLMPLDPGLHELRVVVRDATGQTVEARAAVRVSGGVAAVHILPESGELVPGVENRVYIVGRTLDGAPLHEDVVLRARGIETTVALDEHGVGVWMVRDFEGPEVSVVPYVRGVMVGLRPGTLLTVRARQPGLIVRCARAVVAGGDEIDVELVSAEPTGRVLLALRRNGRAVAMAVAHLEGGRAHGKLRVPAGLSGSVTVEATRLGGAHASSDRKLLIVRGDSSLRVRMRSDKQVYRPGQKARISFDVLDVEGRGVPAAVSLVGVDASLLALAGSNPGLVQALRAAQLHALARPGFPFRGSSFEAHDGGTTRAHATVASLRPPTMRAMRAQLEDLLPRSVLDTYLRGELEELFAREADAATVAARDEFLRALQRSGHESLATALRELAPDASEVGAGWIDQGPWALEVAQAERGALGGRILTAFAVLLILAVAWALARREGTSAGNAMALVTLTALTLGIFGRVLIDQQLEFGISLWAATVVAHVGLIGACPSRRRSTLAVQLMFVHGLGGVAVVGGAGALLVPLGVVLAAFQGAAERRGAWWIGASGLLLGVLLLMGLSTTLIPKGRASSLSADARNTARQLAVLIEQERSGFLIGAPSRRTSRSLPRSTRVPEVRDDFRETLIFAPEIVTDEQGRATIEADIPDSLTRWVLQADVITAEGGLTHAESSFAVSQPLAVDLALPSAVTEGDLLHVRAVVRNTTSEPREVRVVLDRPGTEPRSVHVGAHGVAAVGWPVRFTEPGLVRLTVTADSDAVARELRVEPRARAVTFGGARRIRGDGSIAFSVPPSARRASLRASVRVHSSPLTQVIEGLDSMLREPHGCFEQTSSINYPNIMVLRYLKQRGRVDARLRAKAEDLLARGAQRLLTFEVNRSGGFSLYGGSPASVGLTAYGLMQFRDMAEVRPVDPALLARVKRFLVLHGGDVSGLAEVAYVVWALDRDAPRALVARLSDRYAELADDAYLCALGALAIAPHDAAFARSLAAGLRSHLRDGALWGRRSMGRSHARGTEAETTALAALALMRTGKDPEFAQQLVRNLVALARPYGGWGTTHTTVFALKALLRESGLHGADTRSLRVTVESDIETVELDERKLIAPVRVAHGAVALRVHVEPRDAVVQISGTAYVPWTEPLPAGDGIRLSIDYDRTDVSRGDVVRGTVRVGQPSRRIAVPMVEWGLPAGFRPLARELDAHVLAGRLSRWERAGRTLRLYLPEFEGREWSLAVGFIADAVGELTAAPSRAYPYYEPERAALVKPRMFLVR